MENFICEYGCGKEASFTLKNGKHCCSKSSNSCPEVRSSKGKKIKKNYHLRKKREDKDFSLKELCEYGCNQKANFVLKNGKSCCSLKSNSCLRVRNKNSEGLLKVHQEGKKGYTYNIKSNWNKGLTKENNKSVEAYSKKLKGRAGTWNGRKHTLESKQKISLKANERNNGFVKTKYYEIFCPHENKVIKVQGTYELAYVNYLNKNQTNWIRSKTINLKYKLFEDDYQHTYYPDFYLPDTKEYIEIKGYWWKSEDGRVDDRRKMDKVIEQNKNLKIIILTKKELIQLNII